MIEAFNDDVPYDDFLRMQIAGDLLDGRSRDQVDRNLVATGYLAVGPKSHRERKRAQFELDVADEQIDAITQGMLGLTVACARCHDHKYDPISQQDYYQLAGVLLSSETLFGGEGYNRGMQSDLVDLSGMDDSMPHGVDLPMGIYRRLDQQRRKHQDEIDQLKAQAGTGTVSRATSGRSSATPGFDLPRWKPYSIGSTPTARPTPRARSPWAFARTRSRPTHDCSSRSSITRPMWCLVAFPRSPTSRIRSSFVREAAASSWRIGSHPRRTR